jgi:plasmid stabilization system protein ParE
MIVISPRARRDAEDAYDYIAHDNPSAGDRWLGQIGRTIRLLETGDLKGPTVRLRGGGQAQRWSVPPFRLYYRRTRNRLVILRIYHQARRPIEQ